MINQDPCSRSDTWDSGHGTMTATSEDDPVNGDEELVGAVGGTDENVPAEDLTDVEWTEDDPLFEFNDENIIIPSTSDAASTPVQTLMENKTGSSLESPFEKKPCFYESITEISFKPHTVLGYATLIRWRSTSVEMDISCADISSLPSSVGSAGDMPRPGTRLGNKESAMGGMTLNSVSSTGVGEQDIKEMEKNSEVEMEED